jgi:hypothetical protein
VEVEAMSISSCCGAEVRNNYFRDYYCTKCGRGAPDPQSKRIEELKAELAKWQAMCNQFVGCSMLADEFASEPHEPELFGKYVENLIDQISSLEAQVALGKELWAALKLISWKADSENIQQIEDALTKAQEMWGKGC